MLQVALAPSPVARREIQQRGRTFFEAAAKHWRHPYRPSCAPHQRGFDKIMAQNVPAERLAASQFGQPGVSRKGGYAYYRIVSPIVAFGGMPPGDSRSYRRAVKPAGKLLQSRKQGSRVDDDGQRLDQGNGWMPLHGGGKPHDGVARHQAVSIEYDHMVITAAEALDPVLDIAGFARGILRAV